MGKKDKKSGGLTSIPGGRDGNDTGTAGPGEVSKIIDLTSARTQRTQENRRAAERYFLHYLVEVFCETEGNQRFPIEVVEVSETGCSLRLPAEQVKTLPKDGQGQYLPIRAKFYFSHDSYLLVGLQVVNVTADIAAGGKTTRLGCRIDESFASTQAYRQFVRFIEAYAAACQSDARRAFTGNR